MSERKDLLIEIGTEELPPKALKRLSEAFASGIEDGLAKADLSYQHITRYATPRRLAVLVTGLTTSQSDRLVERRGPALKAAFNEEGIPSPAAQGFAKSCGVTMDDLQTMETEQGAWLVYRSEQKGVAASMLIPAIVQGSLDKLPIPKRMRWGSLTTEFVRPVHWVVLLFGNEVIEDEILGIKAGRETRGHRFHHPASLYLGEPAAYAPLLETEGHVIADFDARREAIRAQVLEAAAQLKGAAVIDADLLDEVASMVEWPRAVVGNFEQRFLAVPSEALISTMKANQKYFHVVDDAGKLMPHFITISNIDSADFTQVRAGNERVVRPRLSDADFFWNQDRKSRLETRRERLKTVVFQNKLGTLYDKCERAKGLAATIAATCGGDAALAVRAAELGKCDLMTEMVGEFPELQGIMGRYYAQHDGEHPDVAQALDEQYMPRHAGDGLPQTITGQALAIADKLDSLVGIFALGQIPTGDKDPFALRRAALGALRIIMECRLELDLEQLLEQARLAYGEIARIEITAQVFDFMMERLRAYYADQGVAHDVFDAVLARRPTRPLDFARRLQAVTAFRELAEADSLAAANKRINNILKKVEGALPEQLEGAALVEPAELALAAAVDTLRAEVSSLFDDGDYETALKRLASLREPVDTFFDKVMVMAEDPRLRDNRLALLNGIYQLFLRAADLSRLQ